MKKIFYILAAAIVALGTVACENEGLDNINPNINVDGDTVSFVAGINRTDLEGVATVWDADDTIVVTWNGNNYEFKNAETGDKNTFKCKAYGLSAIVDAESIKAVYSNNKDGKVDSAAGVAGALLEYEGAFGNIAFEVKNAFLKFTTSETVTLTASEGLFGEGTELVISEAGEHYVAINPVAATLEYKVGESMGKNLETTFEAKKIYNLGNLAKAIAGDSNGKNYTELATAFKLAESGATITLFEDIALEGLTEGALMKVDKNLTLNVGEHTLTATMPTATKNASIFTVTKGAEFTLVGAGNIVIENGGGSNIGNHFISNEGGIVNLDMDGGIELNVVGTPFINCIVDNNSTLGAATLNVKKGTYKQNSGNIFRNFVNHKTELATINISGGSIIGTGEKDIYIWNQKMSKTTGILNITAGTFENVQIDNDDKTLNQVTFTAEGYKLQQNANGYYDVVEWNPVASVGGVEYESFEAALAAAEAGSTIELLANVGDVTISKACVINAGEYTINITPGEGFKVTNDGTTWTVKQLIAFYVENNANWSKVNLYAWDSSAAKTKILGEWPGLEMTRVGETNKYYVEIPEEYVGKTINYIINNGSSQTRDLQVKTFAAGYTHTIGDPDPTKITIYLNNNWSVTNLKMHTWDPVLWSGQTWENQRKPDGTITTDWGTYSYWNVDANQIKSDKTGSLLITGTGKQTADLHNVSYAKDVYIEFVYKNNQDSLQILTTPY